jgi:hypothetical protein
VRPRWWRPRRCRPRPLRARRQNARAPAALAAPSLAARARRAAWRLCGRVCSPRRRRRLRTPRGRPPARLARARAARPTGIDAAPPPLLDMTAPGQRGIVGGGRAVRYRAGSRGPGGTAACCCGRGQQQQQRGVHHQRTDEGTQNEDCAGKSGASSYS